MSKETKQHGVKTRPFTIDPPTLWPRGQHTKCIWLTKEGEAKASRSFRFGLLVNTSQSSSKWPHRATSNVVWIVFLCWVQCNTRISHKSHHKLQETVRAINCASDTPGAFIGLSQWILIAIEKGGPALSTAISARSGQTIKIPDIWQARHRQLK